MDQKNSLMAKIKKAPPLPGCYLFKDKDGFVIYVGKSKSLNKRVPQYFRKSAQTDDKKLLLAMEITDVEFITVPTERDALLLEYSLIKQYKPWFNVQLKADKKKYCIKLDRGQDPPTLTITGQPPKGKSLYLGYFRDEDSAKEALHILNRVWKTPICQAQTFKNQARHCIQYDMKACIAPCRSDFDRLRYEISIREITSFFNGKPTKGEKAVEKAMHTHSMNLAFEKAADCRELLEKLAWLQSKGRIALPPLDRDVLVFLKAYGEMGFSLFFIQKQLVKLRADFGQDFIDKEAVAGFACRIQEKSFDQAEAYDLQFTHSLTDIYAQKLFVPLPLRYSSARLVEIISKEHHKFQNIKK